MSKLLRFQPEPFETDLELQGEYLEGNLAGDALESEAELEFRRSRQRLYPTRPRSAPAPRRSTKTIKRQPPFARGPIRYDLRKPRPFPPKLPYLPRKPPYVRFPTLPLVPPVWPPFPFPERLPEKPEPYEPRSTERPGGEPGGGQPPEQEPPEFASEHVRWVQRCLNQLLGLRLPLDGAMTLATRSAVRLFQERSGLPINGLVGPETERALASACSTESQLTSATVPAGSEPSSDTQPGELPWAPEAEWAVGTLSRRRRRTPLRPALSSAASPGVAAVFDSQAFRQRIVRLANQELVRWGNGTIKEMDPRVRQVLQAYWRTGTGNSYSEAQLGNPAFQTDHPWSAAFISWVMKTAGAGPRFKYASMHAVYTRWAKDNRLANNDNPFKAYRVSELAPQVGDVVCRRRAGSGATYDNIQPGMRTHCDIVTAVQPGRLITVGGNVRSSVAQTPVRTDMKGVIADPRYFAVIRIGPAFASASGVRAGREGTVASELAYESSQPIAPLAILALLVTSATKPTIENALAIVKAISAFHGIPWRLGYTILQHEGGVRSFTHHDGVMQTTRSARQQTIPSIPRRLKLALLERSATDTTPDATLNQELHRAFSRRLAVQIATGIQELKNNLARFNGYVALALQAYNAGPGWAYYTATQGKSKSAPRVTPALWESMCRFGASLLHQSLSQVRIDTGVWQCDANIPAWFSHIPVRDRPSGITLVAYKYLRSISEQIRSGKPDNATCTWAVHGAQHRRPGTGPLVTRKTRDGALDKLYDPRKLGRYYVVAKNELASIVADNLPLKVLDGRLVKMPLMSGQVAPIAA